MPAQIQSKVTDDGLVIEITGLGGIMGLAKILLAAKFRTELQSEFLLSPVLNEIISTTIESFSKNMQFNLPKMPDIFDRSVDNETAKLIISALEAYITANSIPVLEKKRLIRAAFYPWKVPNSYLEDET